MEVFYIVLLIAVIIYAISMWFIYSKAGKPGWAAIIPIYNIIVWLEIVEKPWWWLLLLLIPGVNGVLLTLMTHYLAKSFKKGDLFTVGLMILGFIFYPILAFGDAKYLGPGGPPAAPATPAAPAA